MIPEFNYKVSDIDEVEYSNTTYRFDFNTKRIYGKVNGVEATRQAVLKTLLTERYENVIYSANYGVELRRFIGKDIDFVKSDLERTIKEALLVDDRVLSISKFQIEELSIDTLKVEVIVETIEGKFTLESEVSI